MTGGAPERNDERVCALINAGMTIAVAESCTGGGVGEAITAVAGSSGVFLGGVIAYANDVKRNVLGVPAAVLDAHGAVSEETARAMTDGVKRLCGADVAIAVTGIAGPDGGTPEKPVGTVWFGLSDPRGIRAVRRLFGGERSHVRAQAVAYALELLYDTVRAVSNSEKER